MSTPLLFLDIDGVLNACDDWSESGCSTIHGDKVRLLNRILRVTGCHIVLSSAWRYIIFRKEASLEGFAWILRSHGMMVDWIENEPVHRIIGYIRADTMVYETEGRGLHPKDNERGQQITDWLNLRYRDRYDIPSYVVLDDQDLGISEKRHPFVQTEGKIGLTRRLTDQVIDTFRRQGVILR